MRTPHHQEDNEAQYEGDAVFHVLYAQRQRSAMRMLGANRAPAQRGKSTIRDKHTHWLHRFVRFHFNFQL
jgi:hypothetical protein